MTILQWQINSDFYIVWQNINIEQDQFQISMVNMLILTFEYC